MINQPLPTLVVNLIRTSLDHPDKQTGPCSWETQNIM